MYNSGPDKVVAGVDDATKSPCIGSVFVSGVVASERTIRQWKKEGVRDSKLISRKRRDELADLIKETSTAFCVSEITPERIDDKSLNLNDWEMITALQVLQKLREQIFFNSVIVDNWETTRQGFYKRLRKFTDMSMLYQLALKKILLEHHKLEHLEFIAEHRADEEYTVVGAASILSKSASDKQYDGYRQVYGDFGSGSPGDPLTKEFLWKHRHQPVPIIRTSWSTYQRIALLGSLEEALSPKIFESN